ncbi:DUF2577 domain-containing protein [Levilactobacillus andaensis]|uniref:DUF2577 domain-containing protein n=1 Tax=Levilactobacillus andaensis TaxID=2799570 RepID=UPI001942ECC4|nr:DUF2577 domain-containing protein [Levilactobacillus andaensis]
MAGEILLEMINSRGGSDSDYSDIIFGIVVDDAPLKIQISNQMTLTDAFLNLGTAVTKHKVWMKTTGRKRDDLKEPIEDGTPATKYTEYEVDGRLKKGDGVAMIRQDGGQQFYVLEKLGGDVDG